MNYTLGAIPSPEDKRDYVVSVAPTAFPESFMQDNLPNIKDQGPVGSCVAHECSYIVEHYNGEDASVLFVYGFRPSSYYQGVGMYHRNALETLLKYGDPTTKECPGNIEMTEAKNRVMGTADTGGQFKPFGQEETDEEWSETLKAYMEKAAPRKINAYARVTTVDAMKAALMNGWPIIFTTGISNYYPDTKHIFRPGGNSAGYHSMTAWGWGKIDGEEYFRVSNSWGTGWGDDGWCWMTAEDILLEGDAWSVADTITRDIRRTLKLIPKPRMSGEDVKLAQELLNKHGASIEADGIFGPATDTATKLFQKKKGLTADGIIGADTWAALEAGEPEEPDEPAEPDDKVKALIEECTAFIYQQIGQLYLWGGDGDREITEKTIRAMETSDANAERVIKHWKQMIADGITDIKGYDCSGLISRFLEDKGIVKSKRNSNHLWSMCTPIKKSEMREGDLAFRQDSSGDNYHVGYCPGGGRMIEAKGRDDGVVIRGIDAQDNYWTHYGRPKWKDWI